MLMRYLGITVVTALIGLWLAGGAYGLVRLNAAKRMATGVQQTTAIVSKGMEETEADGAAGLTFPEGQVARMIRSNWETGVQIRALPANLITPSTAPVDRSRSPR